jgi:SAM-dependent methyltransferase
LKSSRDVSRWTFDRWASFYNSSWIINRFAGQWDDTILALSLTEPILDLGCATGRLLRKLYNKGHHDLFGFDLSRSCLRLAKENTAGSDLNYVQGYLEHFPFKTRAFSTLVLSGVLHHLEYPRETLKEAARIVDDKGIFIICEPHFPWGLRQITNGVLAIFPVLGDRRFFTPQRVESMAENEGFRKKDLIKLPFSYILIFERC